MKHPIQHGVRILTWLFAACALGLFFFPRAQEYTTELSVEPVYFVAFAIGFILAGALFWVFALRKFNPKVVEGLFIFGIAVFIGRISLMFSQEINTTLLTIIGLAFVFAYIIAVQLMQKSWKYVKLFTPFSNLIMIFVTAFAGALIGAKVPIWAAFALLAAVALYDAWAVWKSGTMIEIANFFMERRLIPGIAVAYKDKEKFALLGGGDVFFTVAMGAAFYSQSVTSAIIMMGSIFASIVFLFYISEEGSFYPAIPFMFGGAVVGYIIIEAIKLLSYVRTF